MLAASPGCQPLSERRLRTHPLLETHSLKHLNFEVLNLVVLIIYKISSLKSIVLTKVFNNALIQSQ
jgi:hypothetical protein